MSQCHNYEERFSSYIEGELNQENKRNLEQHLQVCPECRNAVGHIRTIRRSMQGLSGITASAQFDEKLKTQLNYNQPAKNIRLPFFDLFPSWKVPAIGFAVVVLMASSVMLMNLNTGDVNLTPTVESGITPTLPGDNVAKSLTTTPANQQFSTISPTEASPAAADSTNEKLKENLKKNLKYVKDNK